MTRDPGRLAATASSARPRRPGPSIASRKGAAAIVIRSIGTDYHRNPHTGVQSFGEGARPIPAGALSLPDAEQLQRILNARHGRCDAADADPAQHRHAASPATSSPRCRAAIPAPAIVLIGGHLDSWDLGTGAIDNAAGRRDHRRRGARGSWQAGRPRRTIRVVWFGAEEVGGGGGTDLFRAAPSGRAMSSSSPNPISAPTGSGGWTSSFAAGQCGARRPDRGRCSRRSASRAGTTPASAGADLGDWVARRRRRDRPQPGRHPLFRLSPHARRHARQGRSRRSSGRMSPPGRRCSPLVANAPERIEPAPTRASRAEPPVT